MQKPRTSGEVYNDLNSDVVNVFRVLRDPCQAAELERLLRLTPCSYEEYRAAYGPCEDPIEKARRTIFRSFTSIGSDGVTRPNSGFRGLKNNQTSVTVTQEWAGVADAIPAFCERLKYVLVEHRDAGKVIGIYDRPETLFYVDPPYLMSTRSDRSVIYPHEMKSEQEHRDLAVILHQVKGMVVLSGYPSELYDELYAGWRCIRKSSTASNGKSRVECIWLSPNIQTTLF